MGKRSQSDVSRVTAGSEGAAKSPDMLLQLGRIAGIGGIAIGMFLLLFQDFIRLRLFPTLTSGQAYQLLVLFLLLTFGAAVIGMATWAMQATANRKVVVALLLFGVALGVAGLVTVKPERAPGTYQVRVTVLTPLRVPVDDAKVWSSVGGEPLRIAGGWMFEVPTGRKPPDGRMRIFAEQAALFLTGETAVELGENYALSAEVLLKREISTQVRGMVMDAEGRAVSGARVTVVGYGGESVITAADGNFALQAHAAEGQQVQLHAEKEGHTPVNQSHTAGSPAKLVLLKGPKQ